MTATIGRHERDRSRQSNRRACAARRRGFLSAPLQRDRRGERRRWSFAGFGIVSPERKSRRLRDGDVKARSSSSSITSRARHDPNSPFDGVVTAAGGEPLPQDARGAGEGRRRHHVRRGRPQPRRGRVELSGAARNYWPERPPRIERYTLEAWTDKVRIPAAQISPPLAAALVDGIGHDARGAVASRRNARRHHAARR